MQTHHTLAALALLSLAIPAKAQLLSNLEAFGSSVSLVDPEADLESRAEDGPKELATADFDGDGKPDLAASKVLGRVVVTFGEGEKEFSEPLFLDPPPSSGELRGISVADLNGDSRPDIIVAAPYSGRVVVFLAEGGRSFADPVAVDADIGVRSVLPLDVDGDGDDDLLAAGAIAQDLWTSRGARIRVLTNNGAGGFTVGPNLNLTSGAFWDEFPRPVFAMAKLPPLDEAGRERAVVTHAESELIWALSVPEGGGLSIEFTVPSLLPTRSVAVGNVTAQGGLPDLVQAARDENQILVRPSDGVPGLFRDVAQRLYVPGSPRAVALADVDADGWMDVLVVLREFDRVVTFRNEEGELKLFAEAPVGVSPRDLETADFNGDGRADLAVSNRRSNDVTVLITQADGAGFERLDSVYPTDGGVSSMQLHDVNNDGKDDVIQTHLLTKELSIRLAEEGGRLGEPEYIELESAPLTMSAGDFDFDGFKDFVIVHSDEERPGITSLFGKAGGGFDPPVFVPSTDRFFSIIVADFDGDGLRDAAVGNYDCRLTIFKGMPGGDLERVRTGLFTYEARAMTAGDFDDDGDLDLAGASANGNMTVVENDGFLTTPPDDGTPHEQVFVRHQFDSPSDKGRIKAMVTLDWDGDDDEDLAINSKDGVAIFIGGEGLTFEALPDVLPGTSGASDLALADFDDDGIQDLATGCQLLSCVIILKGVEGGGAFELATVAPVPSSDYIATGDIDGDGKPDLAGTGAVLWVALSGSAVTQASGTLGGTRPANQQVVINELLASNRTIVLGSEGKTPDVLELFNGRAETVDLAGWTLTYKKATNSDGGEFEPVTYTFPEGTLIGSEEHLVIFCDNKTIEGELHTPFKLSASGAAVTLKEPDGSVADHIDYEEQEADLTLGRFTDGVTLLAEERDPDIGAPNFTFGSSVKPEIKNVSVEPESLVLSGGRAQPKLVVRAEDEVGIFTMDAVWREIDGHHYGRLGLYDDGMNGDGESLDGVFAAEMPPLGPGTRIEFFLQATNLIDKDETAPGDPVFALPGLPVTNYAFTVPEAGAEPPSIEISEVQPHGLSQGGHDYIEIRNTGTSAVDLSGLALRDSVFDSSKSHSLLGMLAPGEHRAVTSDTDLPFGISGGGDSVWMVSLDDRDVATVLQKVRSPDSMESGSWSRLGAGGEFVRMPPTPNEPNVPADELYIGASPLEGKIRLGVRAVTGTSPVVEMLLEGGDWTAVETVAGDGFEGIIDVPIVPGAALFRAR